MTTQKVTCPGCNLTTVVVPGGAPVDCPICGGRLSPGTSAVTPPSGSSTAASAGAVEQHYRHLLLGTLTVSALVIGTLAGILFPFLFPQTTAQPSVNRNETPPARQDPTPALVAVKPSAPEAVPVIVEAPAKKEPAKEPPKQPLPVPRSLGEEVNEAIDRGVVYLRRHLNQQPQHHNYSALVGLALLECGVPEDDPVIERLANVLRLQDANNLQNYQLSVQILFFDRLGKEQDKAWIRRLATLLMQHQYDNGTWSYTTAVRSSAPPAVPFPPPGFQGKGGRKMPPFQKPPFAPAFKEPSGDHSNTQFAALALWVAGRHGVPVAESLARTDAHFRKVQNLDGSWGYHPSTHKYQDSMTCAALMSLAMGHAVYQGYPNLPQDPLAPKIEIIQGLRRPPENLPLPARPVAIKRGLDVMGQTLNAGFARRGPNRLLSADSLGDLYFLWSLERMAMIYNIDTVGNKKWYPWAARLLVDSQKPDGSWHDVFAGPIDTSFALLILKRSNRAGDLTTMIRKAVDEQTLPLLPGLLPKVPQANGKDAGPERPRKVEKVEPRPRIEP